MADCNDCGASVMWYPTETGKRMPVNAGRVPGGNIEIRAGVAVVVAPEPTVLRFVSHHATCEYEIKARAALSKAKKAEAERRASAQLGLFGRK